MRRTLIVGGSLVLAFSLGGQMTGAEETARVTVLDRGIRHLVADHRATSLPESRDGLWLAVSMGSPFIEGFAPVGRDVTVTWRGVTGRLKGTWVVEGREWWTTPRSVEIVMPGDRIVARMGEAVRRLRVPRLALAADRDADLIDGRAPAGSRLAIDVYRFVGGHEHGTSVQVTADEGGGVLADLSGRFDILGSDTIQSYWSDPDGDRVEVVVFAPSLNVALGRSWVGGTARPYSSPLIELRDPSGGLKSTARPVAGGLGSFSGTFVRPWGGLAVVRAGDVVDARDVAADARLVAQRIALVADPDTEVVEGRCPPNSWIDLDILRSGTSVWRWYQGRAGSSGSFRWDLSVRWDMNHRTFDLQRGDTLMLGCTLASGDALWRQLSAVE